MDLIKELNKERLEAEVTPVKAVSYTHLDVYKRQAMTIPLSGGLETAAWTWRSSGGSCCRTICTCSTTPGCSPTV